MHIVQSMGYTCISKCVSYVNIWVVAQCIWWRLLYCIIQLIKAHKFYIFVHNRHWYCIFHSCRKYCDYVLCQLTVGIDTVLFNCILKLSFVYIWKIATMYLNLGIWFLEWYLIYLGIILCYYYSIIATMPTMYKGLDVSVDQEFN